MRSAPDTVSGRVSSRVRDPILWNDVTQLGKTVLAAVVAWVLATSVFDLPQSFLAPWAALLVVHATVYRTFSRGLRQVSAAVLGVVLAWAIGNALGLDTYAVMVVLAVGLMVGALPWFGEESTTVAATALVVLTTGFSDDDSMLVSRLLDTGIGIAVGLLVNLLVWPPLRRRTTITALDRIDDRIGDLVADIGETLESGCTDDDVGDWVDRTSVLDQEVDDAWALVRHAQESARMNPRRSAREVRDPREWRSLLQRMEQSIAEIRSMARTLGHDTSCRDDWDPRFRDCWIELLRDAGAAISAADPIPIRGTLDKLNELVDELGVRSPTPDLWPVYGGLIINLRNLLDAMEEVAVANPLGQPPLPFRVRRPGSAAPDRPPRRASRES